MMRVRIVSLLALAIAVPAAAAAASSFFAASPKPCFVAGTHAYRFAAKGSANFTVRIDNAAQHPNLRMQLVDDPATADFVMVDDGDSSAACRDSGMVKSIRLDAGAAKPDLTVTLSREPAPYKLYVRSATYSAQDAAALFAVMHRDTRGAELAARD